jgi:hypothetical protein
MWHVLLRLYDDGDNVLRPELFKGCGNDPKPEAEQRFLFRLTFSEKLFQPETDSEKQSSNFKLHREVE